MLHPQAQPDRDDQPLGSSRARHLGRRKWTNRLRTLALVAAAFAGGVVSTHLADARSASETQSPYQPIDELSRVLLLVEHNYVVPADRTKLLDGALRGMVEGLDPHSSYMDPSEYAAFQSDTEGKFGGVGVEVDLRDDVVTVIAPIEGSPAAEAGIQAGDKILAVDGQPLRGKKMDRIVDMMRGEPGTKVHLTIGREGKDELVELDLVRKIVRVASVEGKRLDGDIGYVRLKQFQETTHEDLLKVVGALRKDEKPLRGILLDMRYNPGGLVDQAELVADEFLSSGIIYSTRHRGQILDQVSAAAGGALEDLPLVVLVNEYSASAAELVAGALQDHKRATIVGGVTYGKGSVQTIFELSSGGGLRLTTMRYYTPNGVAIQANGVDPDVLIRGKKPPTIVREADLDGHLSAESTRQPRPDQVIADEPADAGPPLLRLSEVPVNPPSAKDFALAKAYDVLVKKLPKTDP
ncbi:MAG: S41 family peptidase [Polyangiaceae bacterium]